MSAALSQGPSLPKEFPSIPVALRKLSNPSNAAHKDIAAAAERLIKHPRFKPRGTHEDARHHAIADLIAQITMTLLDKFDGHSSFLVDFHRDLLEFHDALKERSERAEFSHFKTRLKQKLSGWYSRLEIPPPKELGKCGCRCRINCNCDCDCRCNCRCRRVCEGKCGDWARDNSTSNARDGQKPAWRPARRNLIVSIDGTSNQFGLNNTNVVELQSRIVKDDPDVVQLTYYNSGIGTYAPTSQRSVSWTAWLSSKFDLAFAFNFDRIIQAAYRWLVDHYQPGDRIYLFGFSRGAYQVRTLAAMIKTVGLVFPGNREQIPFAYEIYSEKFRGKDEVNSAQMAKHFKKTFSRRAGVHFLGVWDTVSSVGFMRGKSMPHTEAPYYVCTFRHALALDERRVKFSPEYWNGARSILTTEQQELDDSLSEQQVRHPIRHHSTFGQEPSSKHAHRVQAHPDVKEVWFAGSHSDIGGGNRRNLDLNLAGIPLMWMENEAMKAGLLLISRNPTTQLNFQQLVDDPLVESLSWFWWPLEVLPLRRLAYSTAGKTTRALHLGKGRAIVDGQKLHASVAFTKESYFPFATRVSDLAQDAKVDWPSIVGHTKLDDFSWALGHRDFVDMDLFDQSIVKPILDKLENGRPTRPKDIIGDVNHLRYIALSEDGARSLVTSLEGSIDTIALALINSSTEPKFQAACADCLSQLANYVFITRMSAKLDELKNALTQMVQVPSEDLSVQASGILCLLWINSEERDHSAVGGDLVQPTKLFDGLVKFVVEGLCAYLTEDRASWPSEILERLLSCFSQIVTDESLRRSLYDENIFDIIANLLEDGDHNPVHRHSLVRRRRFSKARRSTEVNASTKLKIKHKDQDYGIRLLFYLAKYEDGCQSIVDNGLIEKVAVVFEQRWRSKRRLAMEEVIRCTSRLAQHDKTRVAVLGTTLLQHITRAVSRLDVNLLSIRRSVSRLISADFNEEQLKQIQELLIDNIGGNNSELRTISLGLLREIDTSSLIHDYLFKATRKNLKSKSITIRYWALHTITLEVIHKSDMFRERLINGRVFRRLFDILQGEHIGMSTICGTALRMLCQYPDCLKAMVDGDCVKVLNTVLKSIYTSTPIHSVFQGIDGPVKSYLSASDRASRQDNVLTFLYETVENAPEGEEMTALVGRLVSDDTLDLIVNWIIHDDDEIRRQAGRLLRRLSSRDAVQTWAASASTLPGRLLGYLRSDNQAQPLAVIKAFCQHSRGFADSVVRAVDSDIIALLRMFTDPKQNLDNRLVDAIVNLASEDETAEVLYKARLFEALCTVIPQHEIGSVILRVLAENFSEEWQEGRASENAILEHIRDSEIITSLIQGLRSNEDSVVEHAARAVKALNTVGAGAGPNLSHISREDQDLWNQVIVELPDTSDSDASSDYTFDTDSDEDFMSDSDAEEVARSPSPDTHDSPVEQSTNTHDNITQEVEAALEGIKYAVEHLGDMSEARDEITQAVSDGVAVIAEAVAEGKTEIATAVSSAKADKMPIVSAPTDREGRETERGVVGEGNRGLD
ncbi:hypothetical protein HGRIS_000233 [Hohenbuehelia grisea]|uniref:T6SS Phospholipase effector Tle1-like catalytic domain-containing protein n=1 Tax=Hohenbuehelia grisea TaxID=104357 RepID=A0ABR3JR74_9AGAR